MWSIYNSECVRNPDYEKYELLKSGLTLAELLVELQDYIQQGGHEHLMVVRESK